MNINIIMKNELYKNIPIDTIEYNFKQKMKSLIIDLSLLNN